MPETIRSSVEVRVDGGPSLGAAPSIEVAAYDKVSVVVAAKGDSGISGTATVELQPDSKDQVELLMVTATRYDAELLTYTLGGEVIKLDSPQLFRRGMIGGLFAEDPRTMDLTNDLDTPVTVSVLVGRGTG
jgi:hypothetical protein